MIKDYTKYELTGREKRIFYFAGYGTVFSGGIPVLSQYTAFGGFGMPG